ncbi:MAG: ABC-2 transporter permease [Oscillospiraceae bacterium]|nr:ABC-2 transporter permease [Oscillospiraceae bacterium]
MKGLFLKDLYMIKAYFRTLIAIAVVFIISSFWGGGNMFLIIYPMIVAAMLPMSILSYDEKSRWDVYCGTLPCSKSAVVSVKYLSCLVYVAVMFALSLLVQSLRITRAGGDMSELAVIMAMLLSIGLVGPSLMLPVIFRLGTEKGRMAYYVVIGALCALSFLLPEKLPSALANSVALLPLAAAALFAASWLLSIYFYRKREL